MEINQKKHAMKNIILTAFTILIYSQISLGQTHKYSSSSDEIAFDGNDLVSYFDGNATKGIEKYKYEYDGLTLHFSTYRNYLIFKKDPDKYMPAYGGWCATAVAGNILTKPDYSMFKIQDEKLLFFEVKAFFNGKTYWEKNPEANLLVADKKYEKKFGKE